MDRLSGIFGLVCLLIAGPVTAATRRLPTTMETHWMVSFAQPLSLAKRAELRQSGVTLWQTIGERRALVSAKEELAWEHLGAEAHRIGSSEKLSAKLGLAEEAAGGRVTAVAEFYPDVPVEAASHIAGAVELEVLPRANLRPGHLLVRGTPAQLRALSEWEELAYVFPASRELIDGIDVRASCGNVLPQSIQTFGNGWGALQQNSVQLFYNFDGYQYTLPYNDVQQAVLAAMGKWASVAKLTFLPGADPGGKRTLHILFASRNHGDGYPFDGPGGVLAHSFYPSPEMPEPLAGDVHLDADEVWGLGPESSLELESVLLHELGHTLGLGHSDVPGAVMYPYYSHWTGLTDEDAGAILRLYPPALPAMQQPGGFGLTANLPSNGTLVTADFSTVLEGLVSGAAAGEVGISWQNDQGDSGQASGQDSGAGDGSLAWVSTAPVPLHPGVNIVTIVATDQSGASVALNVVVLCLPE